MSATRPRRSTHVLFDDLAANLRSQLADAADVIRTRDALIRHLRRENRMLSEVRGELVEELRIYRLTYPHVRGVEGCAERTFFASDHG